MACRLLGTKPPYEIIVVYYQVQSYTVGFIYIHEKLDLKKILFLCSSMMGANNRVRYGPMVVFSSLLHNIIIIIMQTYLKVLNF